MSDGERVIPLRVGRFVRSRRGIVRGDELVSLSPIEIKLLLYLADHPNEELSYERLLTEVWGYRKGAESRTVYSTVGRLRQKIERDASAPEHLLAVPGVGYKFVLHEAPPLAREMDPADAIVGREAELSELLSLLSSPGVVSVVGVGGVGKSRLAEEAIVRLTPRLPGGVLHVELATVSDEDQMVAAICAALSLTGSQKRRERAGRALSERGRCVVLLDEAERVAGRMNAVEEIGRRAPEASFLVTSRLPCGIAGERVMKLGPLGTPASLELLRIRAPGKARGEEEALRALCEAVDGIPLAIELLARLTSLLSPAQLRERLEADLSLLRRRAPEGTRHDSLIATLEITWDLLSEPAKQALAESSVFAGSFDLEAAEAILTPGGDRGPDVVELIEELSLCGLLRAIQAEESRFVLLETVRIFAEAKRRVIEGERPLAEIRHGEHYASFGVDDPRAMDLAGGLARLITERSNLEAAVDRALARGDADLSGRLGRVLLRVYQQTMPARATSALADRLLAVAAAPQDRRKIAYARGAALASQGLLPEAEAQLGALIDGASPVDEAIARTQRGTLLGMQARHGEALADHERAVELLRGGEDPAMLSRSMHHLGMTCLFLGRFSEAERIFEEALTIARRSDLPVYECNVRCGLVALTSHTDRPFEAYAHALAAIELADRCGDTQEMLGARLHGINAARCVGRTEELLQRAEDAITRSKRIGNIAFEAWVRFRVCQGLLSAGRYDESALSGMTAARLFRDAGQPANEGHATAAVALALWRLGRLSEAERVSGEAIALLEGRDIGTCAVAIATRAASQMARERADGVDEELDRADRLAQTTPVWYLGATVRALTAVVRIAQGRMSEASALGAEIESAVRAHGWEPPGGLDVVMKVLRARAGGRP